MANWAKIRKMSWYSVLGISVIAFSVWFYFGEGGVREANRLRDTYHRQQQEIAARELQKAELSRYLEAVRRGDEAALELAARQYGLVGEREYLWKIVPTPAEPVTGN